MDEKLKSIMEKIKVLKDKGTEPAPDYYSQLFIKIMIYGGLDKEDILRYLEYIPSEIKRYLNNQLK